MATTRTLTPDPAGGADDPFALGWRYLRREEPDGTETYEQVPLTPDDLLHPEEGDFIVQTRAHQRLMLYLCAVFSSLVAHDPTAIAVADLRIAWDVPGLRPHGPDVAVITGVRAPQRNWSTFDVAVEGVRPALIVEITSPDTARNDLTIQVEQYALAGVQTYIIVDLVGVRSHPRPRLLGYTLTPASYRPLAPDARGWLWLDAVRAWLGIADGAVLCFDESGQPLGDYTAVVQARAIAERRADVAECRANTAARRAATAERRASAEAAARIAAEQRAQTEAAARAEAEARLRELAAELARLRGENRDGS